MSGRAGTNRFIRRCGLAALAATLTMVAGCSSGEDSQARGDRLWADSSYTEALAEYRLGYQRQKSSDALLERVAHAYAVTGDMAHARQSWTTLVKRSPRYADQAIFDYLTLAKQAQARSDRYGLAGAVEAALALRPDIPVGPLAAGLARYYSSIGNTQKAIEYYQRALGSVDPDSVATMLFELATVHETRAECGQAITMFDAFRARTDDADRSAQARWHIGSCSWKLAQQAEAAGDTTTALSHIQTVIDLGVPQNILDQVWFERGEIMLAQNRRLEALEAYQRALDANRSGTGQLAARAQRRMDEIRFGRLPNQTTQDRVEQPDFSREQE